MKQRTRLILISVLILVFAVSVQFVSASPLHQDTDPTGLQDLINRYAPIGLVWAGTVTALINVLKTVKILPDGLAPTASLIGNLAGLVLFVALGLFNVDLSGYGALISAIGGILAAITGLLGQLAVSAGLHFSLSAGGIPVLGKSHSR